MEPRGRDERLDFRPGDGRTAREINEERAEYLRVRNQELQQLFSRVRESANRRGMVTVRLGMGTVHLRGE